MKNSEEKTGIPLKQTIDPERFRKDFTRITDFRKMTGYSDENLNEFKYLVLTKLEELQSDYFLLKNTLSRQDHTESGETSTYIFTEDAADVFSKEQIAQLAVLLQKSIEYLRNTLVRIENKTYNVYRIHGKLKMNEKPVNVPVTLTGGHVELSRLN